MLLGQLSLLLSWGFPSGFPRDSVSQIDSFNSCAHYSAAVKCNRQDLVYWNCGSAYLTCDDNATPILQVFLRNHITNIYTPGVKEPLIAPSITLTLDRSYLQTPTHDDDDGLQNHLQHPPRIWHVLSLSIPFLLIFLS
jgi:hypothetical protein